MVNNLSTNTKDVFCRIEKEQQFPRKRIAAVAKIIKKVLKKDLTRTDFSSRIETIYQKNTRGEVR